MYFIESFLVELSHLGLWIVLSQFLHIWCLIWIKIHFYTNRSNCSLQFAEKTIFPLPVHLFLASKLIHPHACKNISVHFTCSVMSDSLRPHGLQHTRVLCPSPTPRACSNSCPSSRWCHPIISSSVIPFSSHLQSFPASGSFSMSQLFASGGQDIGVSASASAFPMNLWDWFPLGWTGLIALQSKGLSRVFSNISGCSILFHLSICLDVNSMVLFY